MMMTGHWNNSSSVSRTIRWRGCPCASKLTGVFVSSDEPDRKIDVRERIVGRPPSAVAGGIRTVGGAAVVEPAVEAVGTRHVRGEAGVAASPELRPRGARDEQRRDRERDAELFVWPTAPRECIQPESAHSADLASRTCALSARLAGVGALEHVSRCQISSIDKTAVGPRVRRTELARRLNTCREEGSD